MAKKINFDTSNDNLSRVMGSSIRYQVPPYQRDYSWEEEQWDDLWDDEKYRGITKGVFGAGFLWEATPLKRGLGGV